MAATTMTCADAATAALSVSANNELYNNGEEIEVTGYVTNIAFAWKDSTMSFWMADAADGGNVLEAYKCAVADSATAPKVTDKVKVTGKLTKYNTTPEFAPGCTCEILEVGEGPVAVEIEVTNCATAAQAALSVSGNNVPYNNGASYTVEGYVTAIQNAWANGVMTFWMADTEDGGKVLEAYKCAVANQADAPKVGDKVSVTGQLTKYNTTPEFAQGCTCVILQSGSAAVNLGYKTIAEFLALKNVKDTCILRGAIANIKMDNNDATLYNKYGNFDLVDATGTVYIYGLLTPDGQAQQFREMGLNAGDSITIKAIYTEYNGNPQVANAILVEEEAVEDADVVFDKVDFAGQGVSGGGTNSAISATKDGITVACTNGYGDGTYGFRFYKNSTVTITSAEQQIGKIVFEFATVGSTYYNGDLAEEIVVNGMSWTNTMTNQARVNKLKIYFGEYEQPQPEALDTISVAQAMEIGNALEAGAYTEKKYVVEGYAVSIKPYGDKYEGKQTFYMSDDATAERGDFTAFNCSVAAPGVEVGNFVRVTGKIQKYAYQSGDTVIEITGGDVEVVEEQGIENVVLTEKVQKVMIDGALYIIRDNKLFNVQGVQVR